MKKLLIIFALLLTLTIAFAQELRILPCGDSESSGSKVPHSWRNTTDAKLTAGNYLYQWVGPKSLGAFPSGKTDRCNAWAGVKTLALVNGTNEALSAGSFASVLQSCNPNVIVWMTGLNDWFKSDDKFRPYRNYWNDPSIGPYVQAMALSTGRSDFQQMFDTTFAYSQSMKLIVCKLQTINETQAGAYDGFNYVGYNDFACLMNNLLTNMVDEQKSLGRDVKLLETPKWVTVSDWKHWAKQGADEEGNLIFRAITASQ